jgi:hypothetical protein
VLLCKDCRRPVTDAETIAYRLILGVFYGWCDACFQNRRSEPKSPIEEKK